MLGSNQGHDLTEAASPGRLICVRMVTCPVPCPPFLTGCQRPVPVMQAWSNVQLKANALTKLGQQRLNEEQKVAVASMLLGVAGARPFALNGPPGTGKTVTLVEMGLQVRLVPNLAEAALFEQAAWAIVNRDHSAAPALCRCLGVQHGPL